MEKSNPKSKIKFIAHVSGLVQGVFYRAHTKEKADELGIVGLVKNIPEGVEVIAEGPVEQIIKFERFLWHASPAAKVENINFERSETADQFREFKIF